MNWNRRIATLAGLALLALTNAVALGGVAWNRSSEPDATLHLTQRELTLPYVRSDAREEENSGLSLHLNWRTLPPPATKDREVDLARQGGAFPQWLDANKMSSLGFTAPVPSRHQPEDDNARFLWQTTRSVLIVLELDGAANQEALRRADVYAATIMAKNAHGENNRVREPQSQRERLTGSRLFAIDAGLDAAALRAIYPDRTKYAIVHGRIAPRGLRDERQARGAIESISVDEVNVPLAWRSIFDGIRPSYDGTLDEPASNFQATVAFGRRFEPWLVTAARR